MWSPAHPLPQGVRLQCTGGTDRTIQVLGPNRTSSGPGSLPGAGRLESFFRRWREPVLDLGLERLLYAVSVPGQVLQGRIGAAMQLGPDVWVAQLPEPSNPVRLRRCSVGPVMEPLHDPYVFYEGLVRGWVRQFFLDSSLVPRWKNFISELPPQVSPGEERGHDAPTARCDALKRHGKCTREDVIARGSSTERMDRQFGQEVRHGLPVVVARVRRNRDLGRRPLPMRSMVSQNQALRDLV